jgi:ABC-type uncharacterized transport system permease subunit
LIFLDYINFSSFFDAWANTPILKNIRWQHPFRELASIAAAFCVGIFFDSIRGNTSERYGTKKIINYIFIALFCLLMSIVIYKQMQLDLPAFMVFVSIVFSAMAIFNSSKESIYAFFFIVALTMAINFKQSPFGNKLF